MVKYKEFFFIFKDELVAKNCVKPENVPLNTWTFFISEIECKKYVAKIYLLFFTFFIFLKNQIYLLFGNL